ncbi:MAG TPA: tRNA preQ1(34) S-adenosylmethionine ribosyltransferase-isomerase QueA, partial [Abditibacteriaceae bacterium]
MLVSELDFFLPPELIAQTPAEPRDHSRLMIVRRDGEPLAHHHFYELPELLRPDDLLIFNDTRVIRARLRGCKSTGAKVEALLLREVEANLWEALLRPSARLKTGSEIEFSSPDGRLKCKAKPEIRTGAGWLLRFESADNIRSLLPQLGEVPLPPYIRQTPRDEAQYQTIYARSESGDNPLDSAAAPTAGLHFTPQLMANLRTRGVQFGFVTLAVGLGTFRPIQSETLEEHQMHAEEFEIAQTVAEAIAKQRERGARVIAVGTTAARVLESVGDENGLVKAQSGVTQ